MDIAQSFQVDRPDHFVFTKPNQWPKWIRRFERYRQASGLDGKPDAMHVNALVYAMGDEADDIMTGFGLTEEEREMYQTVKTKFDEHFVVRRNTIILRTCKIQSPMPRGGRKCRHVHQFTLPFDIALRVRGPSR